MYMDVDVDGGLKKLWYYGCPLLHHALPKYLQLDPERGQERALSRSFPRVPYSEALKLARIEAIRDHQNHLTK